MKRLFAILTIALSALFLASCEKENTDTAPVPPAVQTLSVDLSQFQTTKAASSDDAIGGFFNFVATQVTSNWLTIFNNIINVPVEAYRQLVISSEPVQDGNGWIWSTVYTDGLNQKYTVELYGEDKGDTTDWEVRVSKDGLFGYEDFTWITGWSSKDGRSGQWNVKVSPTDTDVLVTLDWTADAQKVQSVKITYQLEHLCMGINPFFNESYIIYSASATDPAYDTSVTAYYNQMGLGFWTVNFEWNSKTGAGRVCSQNQFKDTDWHCWNSTKDDD